MDCRPIANDLSVMILNVLFYFIDCNYCKSNSSELLINIVLPFTLHSRHKKNYRPISLLPITYKVFSHVILRTLDQQQPREQAGFRSGFSTIDHIQVISQLKEKADEYKIPLCFAFVDYEKAFDSIEFNPLFESLENQGVEAAYITLLRDNGATSTLKLHRDSDKIKLQRGV